MAQHNSNGTDTAQSPRYNTPTFDPRGAFAWTLRSGEIARREQQNHLVEPSASSEPDADRKVETNTSRARRYETPTFDPRGAFAWRCDRVRSHASNASGGSRLRRSSTSLPSPPEEPWRVPRTHV